MAQTGGFGCVCRIMVNGNLTAIADVVDIQFPKQDRTLADVTAHDSPNGYAEYLPSGARQLGEMTLTLVWDDTQTTHAALISAFNSANPVTMDVRDPASNELITFSAFVKSIERKGEKDKAFTADVVIQPTGAPTIA